MDYFTNLQKLEQEKVTLKAIMMNEELLEHLNSTIRWLLNYCDKNHIKPPNLDILQDSIKRSQLLLEQTYLPTSLKQPYKTTNNDTEPFFTIRRNINDNMRTKFKN